MNADQIKTEINNIRHYSVESLRALAGIAAEIRGIKDLDTRNELTALFEMVHARRVAVWARISKRFPQVMTDNGHAVTTDEFLSIAYLCQLPEDTALELYAAHADHLNEPNALQMIRAEVNAHKPQRAPRDSNGHAENADTKRLDWLQDFIDHTEQAAIYAFIDDLATGRIDNVRAAIDAAMRADEVGEK